MPNDGPVSIKWQIILSLLFPVTIWVFYRIKKLRLYLLYVIVPAVIISAGIFALGVSNELVDTFGTETEIGQSMSQEQMRDEDFDPAAYVAVDIAIDLGFLAFGAYLAAKWSMEWNRKLF